MKRTRTRGHRLGLAPPKHRARARELLKSAKDSMRVAKRMAGYAESACDAVEHFTVAVATATAALEHSFSAVTGRPADSRARKVAWGDHDLARDADRLIVEAMKRQGWTVTECRRYGEKQETQRREK